ncbi:MAG: ABC transporter ATP-binding protein [Elusimicrobia bacterium]|nr:ABC transporter ATP-binding protein [Elusimicrobiota bacterium]
MFNISLLFISGILESLILITLVPIVDCLSMRDLNLASPWTRHFFAGMNFVGLTPTLKNLFVVLLMFQIGASGFFIIANHSVLRTKYLISDKLLVEAFRDFFSARFCFFSNNSHGALQTTFARLVSQVGDAFGGLGLMVVVVSRIIFYLAVPMLISWQVTLLSVVLSTILVWPFMKMGKRSYRWGQANVTTANDMMSLIQESIGGARVVMGFGNERKSEESLRETYRNHYKVSIKFQTLNNIIPVVFKPLGLGVLIVVLFVARRLDIPFSEITIIVLSFLQMIPLFGQLAASKNAIQNALPSYEQIESLRREARLLANSSGTRTFSSLKDGIEFHHVGFSYRDRPPVLTDVSLKISRGQFVAIAGESGVGKSTLVDLIMALHDPSSGQITLDGIPLREFDVKSYRKRIGYVPQDSMLFNRSVRENLLWANETASESDIRFACQRAHAAEFIEQFPKGYDTMIGDRGVRLSGGQAQRVSLARAILRDPLILILDEATSALDTQSERLIQQAVETIAKGTTVIAIAHRLSTIMNADHIVFLREGRVAEEGTYANLLKQGGYFAKMVQLQTLNAQ